MTSLDTSDLDQYKNPIGAKNDLGRDGAFSDFSILIGFFHRMENAKQLSMCVPHPGITFFNAHF